MTFRALRLTIFYLRIEDRWVSSVGAHRERRVRACLAKWKRLSRLQRAGAMDRRKPSLRERRAGWGDRVCGQLRPFDFPRSTLSPASVRLLRLRSLVSKR